MRRHTLVTVCAATLALGLSLYAQSERKITQLAQGVYEIQHRDLRKGSTP